MACGSASTNARSTIDNKKWKLRSKLSYQRIICWKTDVYADYKTRLTDLLIDRVYFCAALLKYEFWRFARAPAGAAPRRDAIFIIEGKNKATDDSSFSRSEPLIRGKNTMQMPPIQLQ
jgi:hypothetical protein